MTFKVYTTFFFCLSIVHFLFLLEGVEDTRTIAVKNNLLDAFFCQAKAEQSKARLFPLPVGLSRRAFSLLLRAFMIYKVVVCFNKKTFGSYILQITQEYPTELAS